MNSRSYRKRTAWGDVKNPTIQSKDIDFFDNKERWCLFTIDSTSDFFLSADCGDVYAGFTVNAHSAGEGDFTYTVSFELGGIRWTRDLEYAFTLKALYREIKQVVEHMNRVYICKIELPDVDLWEWKELPDDEEADE